LPIVIEDWWQMPDQYKTTSRFELNKKKVSQTQTIDGGTGWMQGEGQVKDLPKEALIEIRKQKFAEDADRLGFLGEKDVEVKALGET
jgi:hypothetical protein